MNNIPLADRFDIKTPSMTQAPAYDSQGLIEKFLKGLANTEVWIFGCMLGLFLVSCMFTYATLRRAL